MATATRPATDLKQQVFDVLQSHVGQSQAIKVSELAGELGIADRALQHVIRELRRDGKPVLATCKKPFGYFLPESWNDVIEFAGSLKSRLIEDALTRRDVLRGAPGYFENAQKVRLI